MESWLKKAALVGATVQERDRQTSELVALELLLTKNNRLGNQEMVDMLLDTLSATQKEIKVTDEIISEEFGGDISDLRKLAIEFRVALNNHEEIMNNLAEVNRTLEILIVGNILDENPDGVRDDLFRKRDLLTAQIERSAQLLDEMVTGKTKEVYSEKTVGTDTSEVDIHDE